MSNAPRFRAATPADLPRVRAVRNGVADNPSTDADGVTDAEIDWYLREAIFLVGEDDHGVQGFVCANHQTGYVWASFVIDAAQRRGHGKLLLDAAMDRLRVAGHRQAFLSTGSGLRAEGFYLSRGWRPMGANLKGEIVYRLWL